MLPVIVYWDSNQGFFLNIADICMNNVINVEELTVLWLL